MSPESYVLIIPSTVYVTARYTTLLDPEERVWQYMDSLSWYIRETGVQKIIVCDNTGYQYPLSLYELAGIYHKEIELLCFKGDNVSVEKYGKGYGEGEIMEYVLAHSRLLHSAVGFIKITGRLKVVNIDELIRRIHPEENYFMPISLLRPRWLVPKAARTCVEVRVYYVTQTFFKEALLRAYKSVRDDETFFLEHAYYQAIVRWSKFSENVSCFPIAPEITGVSGSNGWVFSERSWLKKMLIRLVSRLGYIRPV